MSPSEQRRWAHFIADLEQYVKQEQQAEEGTNAKQEDHPTDVREQGERGELGEAA